MCTCTVLLTHSVKLTKCETVYIAVVVIIGSDTITVVIGLVCSM